MSAPTPADVRAAIAKARQEELARYEADYTRAVQCLQTIAHYMFAPNDAGKLCGKCYFTAHVLDVKNFQPWFQERLTRDNPAWNVTVARDPPKYNDCDTESYTITLEEK